MNELISHVPEEHGEESVIPLPSGPISTEVVGSSGAVYESVLVEDDALGAASQVQE